MCIICNLGKATDDFPDINKNVERAEEFLVAFARARVAMEQATEAMLACAKIDKKYDRTHKTMVGLRRRWNALEESRERADPASPHNPLRVTIEACGP